MLRRLRSLVRARPRARSPRCCCSAAPAERAQLVDAGKEGDGSGGLAFVLFAVMVGVIFGGAVLHGPRRASAAVRRRGAGRSSSAASASAGAADLGCRVRGQLDVRSSSASPWARLTNIAS